MGEGDVPPHGHQGDCCLVMEDTQLSFGACVDSQPCVFLAQGKCHAHALRLSPAVLSGSAAKTASSQQADGTSPRVGQLMVAAVQVIQSCRSRIGLGMGGSCQGCSRFWSWLEMTQAGKECCAVSRWTLSSRWFLSENHNGCAYHALPLRPATSIDRLTV